MARFQVGKIGAHVGIIDTQAEAFACWGPPHVDTLVMLDDLCDFMEDNPEMAPRYDWRGAKQEMQTQRFIIVITNDTPTAPPF